MNISSTWRGGGGGGGGKGALEALGAKEQEQKLDITIQSE